MNLHTYGTIDRQLPFSTLVWSFAQAHPNELHIPYSIVIYVQNLLVSQELHCMLDYDYLGDPCHLLCHAPIPVVIEKVYEWFL